MYRTIAASFWTDPKVKELPADGKLLLLYLITNPHTHVSGIYVLPRVMMCHESALAPRRLDTLCDTLSNLGFCTFDTAKDIVWVRKMMLYQGKGEKNLRSAAAHIYEDLHNSVLCNEFLSIYPDVKPFMRGEITTEIDRVSDTVSTTRTPDSRFPIPDPDTRILNKKEDVDEVEAAQLFAVYNANRGPLPEALTFNAERRRKCNTRLRGNNGSFLAQFESSVKKASSTPFCICGSNGSRWCHFDWFIANDTNYIKVLEGKYDGRKFSKAEERSKRETQAVREAIGDLDASSVGDLPEN